MTGPSSYPNRALLLVALLLLPSAVLSQAEVHPDIVTVFEVAGEPNPGGLSWADSYSVGNRCYCSFSTYDHGIENFPVKTPLDGFMTVRQVCELLGDGPGLEGRPLYNDVQCGNGPPNDAGDEHTCPGRVDMGQEGCGHIGPQWNFDDLVEPSVDTEKKCREVVYGQPSFRDPFSSRTTDLEQQRIDRREGIRQRQRQGHNNVL